MTKSHRKKRSIRKFKQWRLRNKVFYCYICGKKLRQETHHLTCNDCHNKIREEKLSRSKGRDKNFTLVGELKGEELDTPEFTNLNMHSGDNWDIEKSEFEYKDSCPKFSERIPITKDDDKRGSFTKYSDIEP